jgi:tripartite-type tricarboxylate transporter receptor subunit TctC
MGQGQKSRVASGWEDRMNVRALVAALVLACSGAAAQDAFPTKTIKVIVPVPAGSSADLLARIYGKGLEKKWGQPVVIENRVGASHNIGADAAFKSQPDGYTLMTAPPPSLAINQYLFAKLPYDPLAFVPVTVLAEVPNVLVVRPGLGVTDIKSLVALIKSKPGQITYGSTGIGSTLHLSVEAFKAQTGSNLLHVPYTGVPALITEMLAGRIDMTIVNLVDVYTYVQAGSLKALGVGTERASDELPGVPTIASELPGYYSTAWFAVAAPPKTPPALVEKISAAIREVLGDAEGKQLMRNIHAAPVLNTPAEAAAFIRKDSERWRDVIKANNIQAE